MKSKKTRITLKDVEKEGELMRSPSNSPSKPSPLRKIKPKMKQRSDTFNKSNDTSEHHNLNEDLIQVEKGILVTYWLKFQHLIKKIVHNKYFRWFHLCLELIYFTLVLFYLYFVMEIEEDNSIVLLTLMMSFLIIALFVYVMNVIDHWNDPKMI